MFCRKAALSLSGCGTPSLAENRILEQFEARVRERTGIIVEKHFGPILQIRPSAPSRVATIGFPEATASMILIRVPPPASMGQQTTRER